MVAHKRLSERRFTIEHLLAKRHSLSYRPAFLGPYGSITYFKFLNQTELALCAALHSLLVNSQNIFCFLPELKKNRNF